MKSSIEPMLKAYVLPDLASPNPLLQSRACWVYGEFSDFDLEDAQHIQQAVEGVYRGLSSDLLPLKVSAALALSRMLSN